jgi:hypothetical protein
MAEAPFGPITSIWPTVPIHGFGYFQTPVAMGPRPIGAVSVATQQGQGPQGLGTVSGVPSATTLPTNAYAFGSAAPAFGGLTATPPPALAIPESAFGITAPALLAAVGMRRGQPFGPTNDQEIEEFIYDALDLLSGGSDVEVRCEGGRATLTGAVYHKRLKRDIGEIAWAISGVTDVQNNVTIAPRRRSRSTGRESESPAVAGRKQA